MDREKLRSLAQQLLDEVSKVNAEIVVESYLDLVLRQNAELETAVRSLKAEIKEVTGGILKRGHLYKWKDRVMSFASKWSLRYFVLQGSTLSYYSDEEDRHPRQTIDLTDCIVLDEGRAKNDIYHIFSICLKVSYLANRGPQSVLLRLSSDNDAEAEQWIKMLGRACVNQPQDDSIQSDQSLAIESSVEELSPNSPQKAVLTRMRSTTQLLKVPHIAHLLSSL
jgi:hypothetical protein